MVNPFETEHKHISLTNDNDSCFNQLDIDSALKDIGLAMINKNETNQQHFLRLKIMFTKEFIRNLSSECAGLEMMYKYSVRYKKLNDLYMLSTETNYTVQVCF